MVISAQAVDSVQRVCDLEREVAILRNTLAAMPDAAGREQVWKDEVVRLLSEVVLFRLALNQETVLSAVKK